MADFEEHLPKTTLVIAFAGGPQNRFQFGRVLKDLNVPHVLVQDSTQRHYVDGIQGLSTSTGFANYLARLRVKRGFDKVILTGVSSGAYAALLYGVLSRWDVNEIIAISPITGRSESTAADFDPKYRNQIIDPKQPDLDLKPFFHGWRNTVEGHRFPRIRAFISDGQGCELDRGMAERIGITDITVVPGYSHGELGRGMRDLGMFKELFK